MAVGFAALARTFRQSAAKKPLAGSQLRNPGTEVALGGGEFGAVDGVSHGLYLHSIQDKTESPVQKNNANLLHTDQTLKQQWNQMFRSAKKSSLWNRC